MTWPLQTLLDAGYTRRQISQALHVSGHTWHKLTRHGLSDWQADRACIRLGTLPHFIWPDWIDAGLTVLDRDYLDCGWRQAWLHREAS